jgi:hypothetical protein
LASVAHSRSASTNVAGLFGAGKMMSRLGAFGCTGLLLCILSLAASGCRPAERAESGVTAPKFDAFQSEMNAVGSRIDSLTERLAAVQQALDSQAERIAAKPSTAVLSEELDERLKALERLIVSAAQAAPDAEKLTHTIGSLDRQVDAINQALESLDQNIKSKMTTAVLSEELDERLKALERLIASAARSVPDADITQQAIDEFTNLNAQMPPEVQRQQVERLLAVNWNLAAVDWLARQASGPAGQIQEELSQQASDLLNDQLPGAEVFLVEQLRNESTSLDASLAQERQKAIERQIQAIASKIEQAPDEALAELSEIASEQVEVDPTLRRRISRLSAQLDLIVTIRTIAEQTKRLAQLTHPMEKQVALNKLLESVLAVRVKFALDDSLEEVAAQLDQLALLRDELIRDNEAESQERFAAQESKRRAYQSWALGHINEVRKVWTVAALDKNLNDLLAAGREGDGGFLNAAELPSIRDFLNKEAGTALTSRLVSPSDATKLVNKFGGLVSDKTKAISQLAAREAMVRYLVPIDTRFLDQAVAEIYRQTWAEVWASLEGAREDHRLEIAKASVTTAKRTLEDDFDEQ